VSDIVKNLLMIVPFFPPNAGGGVHRPLAFVRYLEQYGWKTTVVTPEAGTFWIEDASLLKDVPESCEVHRTRVLSGQSVLTRTRRAGRKPVRSQRGFAWLRKLGSMALVPDTYVGWYPFAVAAADRLLRRGGFDAVYSTSPPETSHLVGSCLYGRHRVPWVADFRDPWMNLHLYSPPTLLHRMRHQKLERSVCEQANVVVTSRWHAELLADLYPRMNAPTIIANGYDHEKMAAARDFHPPSEPFTMLHAGMLTQKRSALPLLEGLRLFVEKRPDARILVRFVGPRESGNDEAVERLGLSNVVELRDAVSHADSLQLERTSHILLLVKHDDPVYRGIVPGKLFEYVGAQRPILALVPDGEAKDIVKSLHRGETAPLRDAREIARSISLLYQKYERGTLDSDYDLSVVTEYQRVQRTARLAELLESITATA
jgi:glycosyltransferase involved in cell wall biosynthesis